tara:strand:+ start:187 stop:525 length:339 start_codon:yes stop_codon:yes gene_type:complete
VGVGRCLYRDICFPGSSNGFDDAATATAKPTRQRLQLPSIQKMLGLVHGPICAETLKGKYLLPYQKCYAVTGAITQCVTDTCRRKLAGNQCAMPALVGVGNNVSPIFGRRFP